MTNKADIIIWGYLNEYQTENGKPKIKKFKLSEIINNLNFITDNDDNYPFTYYINKKEIK